MALSSHNPSIQNLNMLRYGNWLSERDFIAFEVTPAPTELQHQAPEWAISFFDVHHQVEIARRWFTVGVLVAGEHHFD